MPVTDFQDFTIVLEAPPPPPTNPNPQIVQVQAPASAQASTSVSINVTLTNQGGSGTVWAQIKDKSTGQIVGTRKSASLGSGAQTSLSWSLTMPNQNWSLSAEVGYGT